MELRKIAIFVDDVLSEGGRKLYVVGFVSHIHTIIYHINRRLSRVFLKKVIHNL